MREPALPLCPYFIKEVGTTLYCELGKLRCPDSDAKAHIKTFCCDMQKYKQCTLYQVLSTYYERKYEEYKR